MIVSVYVPVLEKTYEFRIDEHIKVQYVLDELIDIISKSEGGFGEEGTKDAWLVDADSHNLLSPNLSMLENRVRDADMLLLI